MILQYHCGLDASLPLSCYAGETSACVAYDLGDRGAWGIMISRRPNKQQSTERAPGPSNATAAALMTTRSAGKGALNRFSTGGESHERATPMVASATSAPARGVKNPMNSDIPLAVISAPASQVSNVELALLVRYTPPCITAVIPTAARNSSKPTPGYPLGNAEYNRCRSCLLRGPPFLRPHRLKRNGFSRNTNPQGSESFRTTFVV